jgi:hypothetical protein
MATATETMDAQRAGAALFDERSLDGDATQTGPMLQTDVAVEDATAAAARADSPERIVDYVADPDTAEANRRLTGALGVCVVIILVQAAFNLTLYLRRPDRIVVDRTGGGDRVVVMNNREYGLTDDVGFSPDEPTAGDKKYLVSRFLELYYGNNPDIRDRQLNEAIQLMIASRGRELFEYLRRNRVLEQQAAESWQARWTEQQIWVDQSDPFTVHVIGTQALTRVINQRPQEETHQLNVTVKVARDELGRDDRNRRSGYQITWFGWEELEKAQDAPEGSQSGAAAAAAAMATRPPGT